MLRRIRCLLLGITCVLACGLIIIPIICSVSLCVLSSDYPQHVRYADDTLPPRYTDDNVRYTVPDFDVNGNSDVLVFLHIQKTGGTTFGKHLVRDVRLQKPCECYPNKRKCDCSNDKKHVWLFSRYSTGWPCGVHADWTELQNCVEEYINKVEGQSQRRYLYITILREPYYRYLSEWKHVQRGSTWMGAKLKCNGRQASLEEVPFCFNGDDWSGVTLEEFLACPHNLANNRQTRMLANLSSVGCYNSSALSREDRDLRMLKSAKDNLKNMAFFGLTEFQRETQLLFEQTFGLEFLQDFVQHNLTHAHSIDLMEKQSMAILKANALDVELYNYAKGLFGERLSSANATALSRPNSRSPPEEEDELEEEEDEDEE